MNQSSACSFTLTVPAQLFIRPAGQPDAEWQEIEPAPGFFEIPAGMELGVRVHGLNDKDFSVLTRELSDCPALTDLNLSENRNITDAGLGYLKALPSLRQLNLSSVSLSNSGLEALKSLPRLKKLDLSYCNKITDLAVKSLKPLTQLDTLNLQGCVKITSAGVAKVRRRGLEIKK